MAKKKATKTTATKRKLPPDPEEMNDKRAGWAGLAVKAFANEVFHLQVDHEEDDIVLGDLLCNLRHWCDRKGLKFHEILSRSERHYAEEIGCAHLPQVLSPIAVDALNFYNAFQDYINHDDWELPDSGELRKQLLAAGLEPVTHNDEEHNE